MIVESHLNILFTILKRDTIALMISYFYKILTVPLQMSFDMVSTPMILPFIYPFMDSLFVTKLINIKHVCFLLNSLCWAARWLFTRICKCVESLISHFNQIQYNSKLIKTRKQMSWWISSCVIICFVFITTLSASLF